MSRSASTAARSSDSSRRRAAPRAARPQVIAAFARAGRTRQHHRHVGEDLRSELEPADAPLQLREGQRAPPFHGMISPSITVPSGSASPAAASSGKRSVTSSPPRDQIHGRPLAPDQLRADPVPLPFRLPLATDRRATRAPPRARTRGRTDRDATGRHRGCPPSTSAVNHSAVGVQWPLSRCASVSSSTPLNFASARTTSCCDTPTRKRP